MSMSRRLKRIEGKSGSGLALLFADENESEGGRLVAHASLGGTWVYSRVQREGEEEADFLEGVREDLDRQHPGKLFAELIRCKDL